MSAKETLTSYRKSFLFLIYLFTEPYKARCLLSVLLSDRKVQSILPTASSVKADTLLLRFLTS